MYSAIKREYNDGNDYQQLPDLRNMADTSGDFLKHIGGLSSPIQPPMDMMRRAAPFNEYANTMNLTMDLRNLVNEHLRMEEYPIEDEQLVGDHDMQFDMPINFMGANDENAAPFFDNDFGNLIE